MVLLCRMGEGWFAAQHGWAGALACCACVWRFGRVMASQVWLIAAAARDAARARARSVWCVAIFFVPGWDRQPGDAAAVGTGRSSGEICRSDRLIDNDCLSKTW